jgi:hypothetical protein
VAAMRPAPDGSHFTLSRIERGGLYWAPFLKSRSTTAAMIVFDAPGVTEFGERGRSTAPAGHQEKLYEALARYNRYCTTRRLRLPFAMGQRKDEIRDFPPDFHQYIREAFPEDMIPGGELALPSQILGIGGLANGILIRDVVISNTDKNLKNTNRASNSEPSIAINPANPKEIDIFAFTAGWGADAPIWHSTNGGNIWSLDSTIPNPTGLSESGCPCDQTPDYGRNNRLSATFLDTDRLGIDAYSGTTTDPTSAAAWKWLVENGVAQPTDQVGEGGTDQPWLLVNHDPTTKSQDDVYVAYDNFDGAPDMRIAVAAGSDPPDFTIDNLAGFSQGEINPGQRLAVDPNSGAVYTLFQQCPITVANCNNIAADPKTIHWFLNRSTDGGHAWTLNGSSTGIQVATGQSTQPQPKFGTVNALLGGVNHVAVDRKFATFT